MLFRRLFQARLLDAGWKAFELKGDSYSSRIVFILCGDARFALTNTNPLHVYCVPQVFRRSPVVGEPGLSLHIDDDFHVLLAILRLFV